MKPRPRRSDAVNPRSQGVRQRTDRHDQHERTRTTMLVVPMGLACSPRSCRTRGPSGLWRASRDDTASQASLVTADGGPYGGCVPLPPSSGGWVTQPPLPAGTASVTIQSYAKELRGEPAFSLTSGVPHSPQAEPRRPGETVPPGLGSGGTENPPFTRLAAPADWLPEPGSGVASAAGRVKRGPVRPGWPRAGGPRRWRRSPG